jgi:TIR domain
MHVFVSHSRVDSSAAFRLCEELRKRNVVTWLDVRDLAPGTDWDTTVVSAIHEAAAFVFLIGPPGPGDRWQTFEWQQVVDHEYYLDPAKPLIPVLIGEPELPGFLKTRQVLTLGDSPEACERVADEIVNALKNPATSVDEKKLELGRQARQVALKSFQEYSEALGADDLKRAGIRAFE